MRKHLPVILAISIFATLATAGAIKTWASGETLHSSDLNANFAHIHNLMVGGHGARLVDADVNGSAAIAMTKISGLTAALIPKAFAMFNTNCGTGATVCNETLQVSSGVTSIQHTALGSWLITWATVRADAKYATVTTSMLNGIYCTNGSTTATTQAVYCQSSSGAADPVGFSMFMMDNL